jgi:hypothetical protein
LKKEQMRAEINPPIDLPAGSQILGEFELSWWAKGNGALGVGAVSYELVINPYIDIESCSYEMPDSICIQRGQLKEKPTIP